MALLDSINSSEDVKKLNISELETLAAQIRSFLVENVSARGGHLSSNLGTVELTLALHKVFDVSKDRLVWDVGHQAYTHKIITGRRGDFATLRKKDGLSGFPKTEESVTDAFNTGHSSTSVSAALGFAKAFELEGSENRAVAIIGDGALTGGMAYEALNHAGSGTTPLIVILNDNGMSISQNVGGLADYLEKICSSAKYIGFKNDVKRFLSRLPVVGAPFTKLAERSKCLLKKILLQRKLFENMGLEYLGPVDGHNLYDLIVILEHAKTFEKPVIVHVRTQKGRGYKMAEENPSFYHGVQKFDPDTGECLTAVGTTYSDVFGEKMCELGEKNERLVCITAAMPTGTGLVGFAKRFPNRFFDVGIAEQHAVTFAAAMAMRGFTPVFAVYSSFLQRGFDQIYHDVALQNLHTVFAIDRAGAVGSDGETHQGIYDLSYLSLIPNMTVMAPSSEGEMRAMLDFAVNECSGPVAVRYPKGETDTAEYGNGEIQLGKGVACRRGSDVLIVAIGAEVEDACRAAELLEKRGISAGVMNARFLKPFDSELFADMAKGVSAVVTVEDNTVIGGLGAAVAAIYDGTVHMLGFADKPLRQASVSEQKHDAGIDGEGIAEKISEILGGKVG
mgnify:CR=1 FL=1